MLLVVYDCQFCFPSFHQVDSLRGPLYEQLETCDVALYRTRFGGSIFRRFWNLTNRSIDMIMRLWYFVLPNLFLCWVQAKLLELELNWSSVLQKNIEKVFQTDENTHVQTLLQPLLSTFVFSCLVCYFIPRRFPSANKILSTCHRIEIWLALFSDGGTLLLLKFWERFF